MKRIIQRIMFGAVMGIVALPVAAKGVTPNTRFQDQCTDENKTAWYATFRATFKTDQQPKAYEAAKKYLAACSSEDTQITQYLKKWVGVYEKEIRKVRLPQLLYNDKKYPEAFALGREILADEPENLRVLIDLGYGGYLAATAKNNTFNADAINYAKKALQMIESGKTVDNWQPFGNKEEALAYLNYSIGVLTLPQDPQAALSYLIKAAQFQSNLKQLPFTYGYIGGAYEAGPYAKQSEEYKRQFEGKDETPESKLALANINQIVDRMVDAYARAVAAAGEKPEFQTSKKEWTDSLSSWYKYRHNQSDAGMTDMVATILSKPLPPEPTPLTSLPPSAPTSTPAAGGGTSSGASGAPAGTGSTTNTTTPSGPAKTTTPATTPKGPGTKPASATGPGRPRSRSHH
ncbi:MAG: tetratricopeptide repeat protein [Pyrinomonadaceae bacterium]